jgi:hypothetical protein
LPSVITKAAKRTTAVVMDAVLMGPDNRHTLRPKGNDN